MHLGLVREAWAREEKVPSGCAVTIADGCTISANVVIHDSSSLESSCFVDDGCRVGYGCRIGAATRLEYGAFIGDRVAIGESCVIAGFVCDGVVIGRRVIAMGNFVHKLSAPHEPWGAIESAAVVEDGAVVGLGATVVGGVTIGRGSYVAAAALVSKDVPPHSVVTGVNAVTAMSDWQGSELRMGL
ncbi:acyltransferase [Streptomyces sp. NPDC127038]|uniref:acyltransferase n=1 Tax=Streptomyces sp. NPDC127038 TaxID=3347114 RepID=UPI003665A598